MGKACTHHTLPHSIFGEHLLCKERRICALTLNSAQKRRDSSRASRAAETPLSEMAAPKHGCHLELHFLALGSTTNFNFNFDFNFNFNFDTHFITWRQQSCLSKGFPPSLLAVSFLMDCSFMSFGQVCAAPLSPSQDGLMIYQITGRMSKGQRNKRRIKLVPCQFHCWVLDCCCFLWFFFNRNKQLINTDFMSH